ncbi:heavy metal translocating P-type ATPase [uncultured Desulfovibrio sp.]|uniref:heavy metal translocating P-type ATPase n=1 Tax=uncultured Desulfovibrio sp. TaxID=167968 RepID=UPI00262D3E70|nr:heavy metal translocating P-type ATPase [uncultured Desulfovibrio sp.]
MRFFIVHELVTSEGVRLRARADRHFVLSEAEELADVLDAVEGVEGVRVNPLVGSVLLLFAPDARERVLSALAEAGDAFPDEASQPALAAPRAGNDGVPELPAVPGESGDPGLWPLFRFLFLRPLLPPVLRIFSSLTGALPFLCKGVRELFHGRLNVDVLDAAAIGVSLLRRDFSTVTMLTLLLGLGETLEAWTRRKSLESLSESLALNVDQVWLLADGAEICVPLSQVREGDLVVVRDGGSIPVDGVVEDGEAVVNQASMTGEPLGVPRGKGASVYSGTVVEQGRLVIRAVHVGDGTRLQQVVAFIEQSEALKAGIQGRFERMADMAVPFTFGLAGLVWLLTRDPLRASSVLLVDYSCALRLATPLAVLAAMREGARHGVVVKGGRFLEALAEVDTVVFDKTGTLTSAQPSVRDVVPAPGFERDFVLRTAACLEEHFPHPVARAIVRGAQDEGLQHEEEHAEVRYVVAHGVSSTLYGQKVCVGSRHYIEQDEGVCLDVLEDAIAGHTAEGHSLVYLAVDGRLAGFIAIEDPLRPEAASVVEELRRTGIRRILMLTGDDERTARAVASRLGITEYRAGVLPTDKAGVVEELTAEGCKVLMIGDGINDAPALSASHVGISMCGGADLAREVANVQLSSPDLRALLTARELGRCTLRRIHGNFGMTMVLNSLFLAGGLFSILSPGVSALLHNLTTLGVSLNAMRPHFSAEESRRALPAASGEAA